MSGLHDQEIQEPLAKLSRLPPLTALRAFVATARHLTFIGAAQELHVTTAAVSQQIRVLEEHLGRTLFVRGRGRLYLTETGHALVPGLTTAFDTVLESISSLASDGAPLCLRVAVEPAFAARWLLPRLPSLRAMAPGLQLVIDTSGRTDADCAIVYGPEGQQPPGALRLFGGAIIAVVSPELSIAITQASGDAPALLQPLLHADPGESDPGSAELDKWLRAEELAVSLQSSLMFTDPSLLIDATLAGLGIGLVRYRLVERELGDGRLVSLFDQPHAVSNAYFLIMPRGVWPHSATAIFSDWLLTTLRMQPRLRAGDAVMAPVVAAE